MREPRDAVVSLSRQLRPTAFSVHQFLDALCHPQDKYVFDYVSDAGPKAMGRIVPKGLRGREEDFFTAANMRFASNTGMPFVARPTERPKGRP